MTSTAGRAASSGDQVVGQWLAGCDVDDEADANMAYIAARNLVGYGRWDTGC